MLSKECTREITWKLHRNRIEAILTLPGPAYCTSLPHPQPHSSLLSSPSQTYQPIIIASPITNQQTTMPLTTVPATARPQERPHSHASRISPTRPPPSQSHLPPHLPSYTLPQPNPSIYNPLRSSRCVCGDPSKQSTR